MQQGTRPNYYSNGSSQCIPNGTFLHSIYANCLVDVGKDLATDVLATGLLVVHDTGRGGEDDLAERTGGEEEGDPVLDGVNGDVEAGRDNAGLVETAVKLDDDLAATVVVDDLELADVA